MGGKEILQEIETERGTSPSTFEIRRKIPRDQSINRYTEEVWKEQRLTSQDLRSISLRYKHLDDTYLRHLIGQGQRSKVRVMCKSISQGAYNNVCVNFYLCRSDIYLRHLIGQGQRSGSCVNPFQSVYDNV